MHVKHTKFIFNKNVFREILNGFSQPGFVIIFNSNACFWLQCSNHFLNKVHAMYLAAMTTDTIIEESEILHVSGLLALQEVVMGVVGHLLGLLVMVAVDLVVVVVVWL